MNDYKMRSIELRIKKKKEIRFKITVFEKGQKEMPKQPRISNNLICSFYFNLGDKGAPFTRSPMLIFMAQNRRVHIEKRL